MQNSRAIERFGELDTESNMAIDSQSSKPFRIISTIVYKDRIRAIIRELSCNAYDSHKESGIAEKPFEVHLPTRHDPYFSVRDFGAGISPEKMESVYCTYFRSTKEDKPDQIGSLGLGSKSPLCYTNSFSVTSYTNGMRHHYVIFFDEKDIPTIKLLSSEPSNEETGLEVKVPLANTNDISAFPKSASEIFYHFNVRPKITGTECNIPEKETILSGDNWKYVSKSSSGSATAIMSQVSYPIDWRSIPNLSPKISRILENQNIEIEFPNNSLSFMAGRDDLTYDKKTCKALIEAADKVDGIEAINREIAKCKNEHEAKLKIIDIENKTRNISSNNTYRTYDYNGKKITTYYSFLAEKIDSNVTVKKYQINYRGIMKNYSISVMEVGEYIEYFIDNTKKGLSSSKIRNYIKSKHKNFILYVIDPVITKLNYTIESQKIIQEAYPDIPYQYASNHEINKSTKCEKTTSKPLKPYSVLYLSYNQVVDWSSIYHFPEEGGIYVLKENTRASINRRANTNRYPMSSNNRSANIVSPWALKENITEYMKKLYSLNIDVARGTQYVYGFTEKQFEKLKNKEKWIELNDYVKMKLKEMLSCYGGDIYSINKEEIRVFVRNNYEFCNGKLQKYIDYTKNLDTNHPLKMFFEQCNILHNHHNYDKSDNFVYLLQRTHIIDCEKTEPLQETWNKLDKKYPLLCNGNNVSNKHMECYIAMCDDLEYDETSKIKDIK